MVRVTLHSFEAVDDADEVRKIDWCLDVCESTVSEKKTRVSNVIGWSFECHYLAIIMVRREMKLNLL